MANFGTGLKKPAPPRRPLTRAKREPTTFEQLLELKWRGIGIPCSSIRLTLDHNLVFHKYYGVDGVNIEDTGLDGMKIDANIPLYNGMAAAPTESWGSTRPFPELTLKLVAALRDKSTGELQHPLLGPLDAKVQTFTLPLEAEKREGTDITATWVEYTPLLDTGESERYKGGPIAAAQWAAVSLDTSLADLRDKIPDLPQEAETFDSMMNKIAGAMDRVSVSAQLLANKPAQLMARVNRVQQSAERVRDATLWPVIDSCERLRDALHRAVAGSSSARKTKIYVTPAATTLVMVANTLKASIDDLTKLNRGLLGQAELSQGTAVRYFG